MYTDGKAVGGGFHISPALEALARLWGPPWCWSLGCGWHRELTDLAVQPPGPLAHPVFCSRRPRGSPARARAPAEPGRPPSPAGRAPAALDTGAGFRSLRPAGLGCPGGACGQGPACRCRRWKRLGSSPGWGRHPGGGHGNPLQCSCLENPMDRGAWRATVRGVEKSQTGIQCAVQDLRLPSERRSK